MSATAAKTGADPGVKYDGGWDERPHPKRVVRVTPDTLRRWRRLAGDEGPLEHTRLLTPVSTAEDPAIDALGMYSLRLGALYPDITRGFDESSAKKAQFGPGKNQRLIDYNTGVDGHEDYRAEAWNDVILKGPQIGVANPMFKQPSQGSGEVRGLDPRSLADDAVPESEYRCVAPRDVFLDEQDRWPNWDRYEELLASEEERGQAKLRIAEKRELEPEQVEDEQVEEFLFAKASSPYSEDYRVAWRRQIAPDTERALYAALTPPGASHIHMVHSARLRNECLTVLNAGFWASLPLDYLLRTTGRSDLQVAGARAMPAPQPDHPLAPPFSSAPFASTPSPPPTPTSGQSSTTQVARLRALGHRLAPPHSQAARRHPHLATQYPSAPNTPAAPPSSRSMRSSPSGSASTRRRSSRCTELASRSCRTSTG
ncbi:hypothetical protein NKH18_06880 [Streptomyces sp. M10(2022)]